MNAHPPHGEYTNEQFSDDLPADVDDAPLDETVDAHCRATEESVPVDALHDRLMDSQIEVWNYWGALVASLCAVLLTADVIANIVGIPLFSGPIIRNELASADFWGNEQKAIIGSIAVTHLLLLGLACYLTFRSPWRNWLPALFERQKQSPNWQSFTIISGAATAGLAAVAVQALSHSISVAPFQRPLIAILIIVSVLATPFVLRMAWLIFTRGDKGTTTGIAIGAVLVFFWFMLFSTETQPVESYAWMCWGNRRLLSFRYVEFGIVALWLGYLRNLCRHGLDAAIYFRLTAPASKDTAHYPLHFNLLNLPTTFATVDRRGLRKSVVLERGSQNDCRIVDDRRRLRLSERRYDLLHLDAFHDRIGDQIIELKDSGQFIVARYQLRTDSRSPGIPNDDQFVLPAHVVDSVIDGLFNTEDPNGLFQQVLNECLDSLLCEDGQTAQDFADRYSMVFSSASLRAGSALSRTALNDDVRHSGVLPMTRLGTEYIEVAQQHMLDSFTSLSDEWQKIRRRTRKLRTELPAVFQQKLTERLVSESAPWRSSTAAGQRIFADASLLVRLSGVTLQVNEVEFCPGAAARCEAMLQEVETWTRARLDVLEQQMIERDAQWYSHQMTLREMFLELQKYPHVGLSAELFNQAYALLQNNGSEPPINLDGPSACAAIDLNAESAGPAHTNSDSNATSVASEADDGIDPGDDWTTHEEEF